MEPIGSYGTSMKALFSALEVYRYIDGEWKPARVNLKEATPVAALRVVTYNTLFDYFDADKIYTLQRNRLLFKLLESTDADIIGLQEVTPKVLVRILDEPWVRAKYFVSENPSNSGESVEHYGQVILSRYPFKAFKHSFSKFKRVLLGEFNFNGRSTFIPVLHLTSNEGKNRDPKTKRMAQLQTIFERTCPPLGFIADDGTDAVIMGDFNFGDTEENDLIRDDIRDVWRELRPAEVGYTVDPKKNSIAKITCHNKNRYDRVLLRSMVWEPVSIRLLGDEATSVKLDDVNSVDLFPSDHFGVEAVLHFSSEDDALVKTALQAARMIESADGNAKRDNAIEFLNTMYNQWLAASEEPSNDTNVIAIGSYALGIHSASGDVDALCVGNLAPADFFKEFPKILKANGNRVGLIRVVTDALVPLIKTSIDGIKFDILYANVPIQMPTSLNLKKALTTLEDNILRSMDDQSVLSLNGHIEAQLLLSAVPNIPHFQTVCRFIKLWATRKGLYSNTMCYLGGYGWSIMVANVCQKFPDLSPSQLIARFFDTYANWNWKEQAVVLDVKPKISYSLDPKKDVLAVITLSRPFRNTARNVTKTALSVLKAEFAQARAVTNSKSPVWSLVLRQSDFFTQYKSYLKVVTSAVSADEFARWKGWVESRLVSLCHNLDLQGVFAHSFPVAFPNKESAYPYSVFYFIGVKKFEKKDEAAPEASNDKPTEQKPLDFAQTIYKFQDMLTGWNDKSAGMDVQIKHIKGDRLPAIVFEQSLDLDYLQIAAAESSDEASSSDEAVVPSSPPKVTSPGVPVGSATAKKVGGFPPTPKSQQPAKKSGKKKGKIESPKKKRIRPSWDVFNRILWDPKLSKENFIIGYLDRFEGIMEVPAFEFDNSTIPWHRVYYFRRDGEVVWDRNNRIDLIFGDEEGDDEE